MSHCLIISLPFMKHINSLSSVLITNFTFTISKDFISTIWKRLHICINLKGAAKSIVKNLMSRFTQSKWWTTNLNQYYMDKGRSILRFFFLATLTCFVTFMHKSKSIVIETRINARRMCLKYKETAENTKKARITSSHITNITTSTLQHRNGKKKFPIRS